MTDDLNQALTRAEAAEAELAEARRELQIVKDEAADNEGGAL